MGCTGTKLYDWVNQVFFQRIAPGSFGTLLFAVVYMLICWSVGFWLDKRENIHRNIISMWLVYIARYVLGLVAGLLLQTGRPQAQDLLSYVNPMIGTAKSDVYTRWGNEGGTYPGAVAPWGFLQMTPETQAGGGYDYTDSSIRWFSCVSHRSGYPDGSGGQIRIMPVRGGDNARGRKKRRSSFPTGAIGRMKRHRLVTTGCCLPITEPWWRRLPARGPAGCVARFRQE